MRRPFTAVLDLPAISMCWCAHREKNGVRLKAALAQFGFDQLGLSEEDFLSEGQVVQLGVAPNRIDILTSITGCEFDEVWRTRVAAELAGVPVNMIAREAYIKNKRASGPAQDLADLDALT